MKVDEIRQLMDQLQFPMKCEDQDWRLYPHASCYTYALGLPIDKGFMIGDFIGERVTCHNSVSEIVEVFKREMEFLDFWAIECDTDDVVEEGNFKIYLEFDECNQYHFFRENADETWSHKMKGALPSNKSLTGRVILDPEALTEAMGDFGYCFMICRIN